MEPGTSKGRPVASLFELSRVLEETARLVREHATGHEYLVDEIEAEAQGATLVETDPHWVRGILDLRGLRREFLGFEASDAAFAMLLELYAVRLEGRRLHQTALAVAARVPETTALRLTYRFVDAGIFVREADAGDKRLLLITLSDATALNLRAYLAAAAYIAPVLA